MPDPQDSLLKNSPIAKIASSIMATIWSVIRPFSEHLLQPLYRVSSKSSFGKIWSTAMLAACMYYWLRLNKDIPETLEYMTQVMLLYVFSTKPVQIVRDHVAGKTTMSLTPDAGDAKSGAPKAPAAKVPAQDGDVA